MAVCASRASEEEERPQATTNLDTHSLHPAAGWHVIQKTDRRRVVFACASGIVLDAEGTDSGAHHTVCALFIVKGREVAWQVYVYVSCGAKLSGSFDKSSSYLDAANFLGTPPLQR
jgi:hypothetical protein